MRSKLALVAAVAATFSMIGSAQALTIGYTEEFPTNVAGWENAGSSPLTWQATGGPDGSSNASTTFNWFGFSSPFGGGPVIFRAADADNASGDAFVGDWLTGGVHTISAWFYQETGETLTPFIRFATSFNFPGAVINDLTPIPSGVWTEVLFDIDPLNPLCFGESVSCAVALSSVGNVQFGTNAPAALVATDQSYYLAIEKIGINTVPEPTTGLMLAVALSGLGCYGRLRRA
jgi:hypothetical protein